MRGPPTLVILLILDRSVPDLPDEGVGGAPYRATVLRVITEGDRVDGDTLVLQRAGNHFTAG